MAHLADAVGAKDDAAALRKRAQNYRGVIDPETRFARPRFKDGSWWKDYDPVQIGHNVKKWRDYRSEEHTSELQSLMRISYAVFCLIKKRTTTTQCSSLTTSSEQIIITL